MGFTKETLWTLRKEIVLNSLFIADYRNSLNIDPHMLCNFFDGFLEEVETQMEEEIPGFKDAQFFDYLPAYDTSNRLWDYYSGIESELATWEPEVMEAA